IDINGTTIRERLRARMVLISPLPRGAALWISRTSKSTLSGALDTHAHAMPPSCHKHPAAAGFLAGAGFCTGLAFLRVARTAVRFIDLNVADLTFAGRPPPPFTFGCTHPDQRIGVRGQRGPDMRKLLALIV